MKTAPAMPSPSLDLDALQAGDPAAWRALLAVHGPGVYALCRRLDPDPDDAYQAIWERAHQQLHRFDPAGAGSLGGWLRTMARRALIDRHRKRQTRGAVLDRLGPPPAVRRDLADDLHRHHQQARLEAAVQRLPPGQRRAVVLHHIEGHDLADIATLEGVPVNTIKSRLHRGRARLTRLLGGPHG